MTTKQTNQAQITVLEFPYCVQQRKGMYLSSKDQAIYEIIDNGIDEHAAGYANTIILKIDKDQVITVIDNGRGIPVTKHSKYKDLSQAEVAYTVLHAGGKFGDSAEGSYKTVTGGLNGVGASVVNALSEWLELEIYTNNEIYKVRFEKGKIVDKLKQTGTYDQEITGTSVSFKLDDDIWKEEYLDLKHIVTRMRELAFLNPKLKLVMDIDTVDKDGNDFVNKDTFEFPEGLKSYIERLTKSRTIITPIFGDEIMIDDMQISFAFANTEAYSEEIKSYVNNISTHDGGDHLIGLKHGISAAVNKYALETKVLKDSKFEIADALEGVVGIISIKVIEPQFDGQSKSKIKMPKIKNPIRDAIADYCYTMLDSNPDIAKVIMDKALLAQKARSQAAKVRESIRKQKTLTDGNPEKFAHCQSKDPAVCEVWVAEGDSAGGSLKMGRDRKNQAILPIFGKILNVEKSNLIDVLKNPKLLDLLKALKCGIGEEFDIEKIRFHKIILASDADVDGKHIQALFLAFFYSYLRPIIEAGYLYVSIPPLYKLEKGKTKMYAYSDEEKNNLLTEMGTTTKIQRYKGLAKPSPYYLFR